MFNAVDNLPPGQLVAYLNEYGVAPLPVAQPPNAHATNCLWKEVLKGPVWGSQ